MKQHTFLMATCDIALFFLDSLIADISDHPRHELLGTERANWK